MDPRWVDSVVTVSFSTLQGTFPGNILAVRVSLPAFALNERSPRQSRYHSK